MEKSIRYAKAQDKESIVKLFNVCFPGEELWAKFFFDNVYTEESTLVCTENGELAATVQMLPVSLRFGNDLYKASYLFGVGTDPKYRGKKIMERVLEYAFEENKKAKVDFSTLIAQNDTLFEYYKRFGYEKYFYAYKDKCTVQSAQVDPCAIPFETRHSYDVLKIYEDANKDRLHAVRGAEHIGFMGKLFYTDTYVYDDGTGVSAYAIGIFENGELDISEMAGKDKDKLARALCALHGVSEYTVMSPENKGHLTVLGMIKNICAGTENLPEWGYINILYN